MPERVQRAAVGDHEHLLARVRGRDRAAPRRGRARVPRSSLSPSWCCSGRSSMSSRVSPSHEPNERSRSRESRRTSSPWLAATASAVARARLRSLAVDRVELHVLQLLGQRVRLLAPELVQLDVRGALNAELAVPVRLAVSRQEERGHASKLAAGGPRTEREGVRRHRLDRRDRPRDGEAARGGRRAGRHLRPERGAGDRRGAARAGRPVQARTRRHAWSSPRWASSEASTSSSTTSATRSRRASRRSPTRSGTRCGS